MSPTLPAQNTYSAQMNKIQLYNKLHDIPKVKILLAWKFARISKKKESMIVPSKKKTHQSIFQCFLIVLSLNKDVIVK